MPAAGGNWALLLLGTLVTLATIFGGLAVDGGGLKFDLKVLLFISRNHENIMNSIDIAAGPACMLRPGGRPTLLGLLVVTNLLV